MTLRMTRGKALFRGLFRCRDCGHVHGAYGVQVGQGASSQVFYPVEENGLKVDAPEGGTHGWRGKMRLEPDRCPCEHCSEHPVCQYLGGTRIEPIESLESLTRVEIVSPNHKRRGGWIAVKKAG